MKNGGNGIREVCRALIVCSSQQVAEARAAAGHEVDNMASWFAIDAELIRRLQAFNYSVAAESFGEELTSVRELQQ